MDITFGSIGQAPLRRNLVLCLPKIRIQTHMKRRHLHYRSFPQLVLQGSIPDEAYKFGSVRSQACLQKVFKHIHPYAGSIADRCWSDYPARHHNGVYRSWPCSEREEPSSGCRKHLAICNVWNTTRKATTPAQETEF